ncbi:MAG: hypothetical protein QXK69_09780, partial [Candidatus Caldarchaeum sp.]
KGVAAFYGGLGEGLFLAEFSYACSRGRLYVFTPPHAWRGWPQEFNPFTGPSSRSSQQHKTSMDLSG